MSELSKVVADRLSVGEAVSSAIEVQGARVIERLGGSGLAAIPRELSFAALLAWLLAVLGTASEALRARDRALAAEAADDAAPRAARDAATLALRERMLRTTGIVSGVFGVPFSAGLGLERALAPRPDQLALQAADVSSRLRAARAPEPDGEGVRVDLAVLADRLDAARAPLDEALAAVKREEREYQTALVERDRADEAWGRTYIGVAEIFTGLCVLAGEQELADRVRPTARKRAGTID